MKATLYLFLFLTSSSFLMANEKGNGGDAVVCYDTNNRITSVELLDFYEAKKKGRIRSLDLGDQSLTVNEKVKYVLKKLERINPSRAKKYELWLEEFFSEDLLDWSEKLVNIDDTGALGIPENCEVEQVAVQEKPLFKGDKRYVIRKKLWDLMSKDHKAGLVLHELIYREASEIKICIKNGYESFSCYQPHQSSKKVRYFNSMISSENKLNNISDRDYHQLIVDSDLVRADVDIVNMKLQYIHEGKLVSRERVYAENDKLIKITEHAQGLEEFREYKDFLIRTSTNGSSKRFYNNGAISSSVEVTTKNPGEYIEVNSKVSFLPRIDGETGVRFNKDREIINIWNCDRLRIEQNGIITDIKCKMMHYYIEGLE